MTYDELRELLTQAAGIPFALHHWDAPPQPPYGVYFDGYTANFAADDVVYDEITHFLVEVYGLQRDRAIEQKIEAALTGAGIYWERSSEFIESEGLYQTSYEIEV